MQKYRTAYGRVQKVTPTNSKAVDGTLSYCYKVQSQKYSSNNIDKLVSWIYRFDLLHSVIILCSSVLSHPLICSFDLLHQIGGGNTSPTPTPLWVHPWICMPGIHNNIIITHGTPKGASLCVPFIMVHVHNMNELSKEILLI